MTGRGVPGRRPLSGIDQKGDVMSTLESVSMPAYIGIHRPASTSVKLFESLNQQRSLEAAANTRYPAFVDRDVDDLRRSVVQKREELKQKKLAAHRAAIEAALDVDEELIAKKSFAATYMPRPVHTNEEEEYETDDSDSI
mmetsp:Transcript_38350/g.46264  ORF Transcript_38350/g.46264 Transcript_38350/m.46264 type:complete len:140 (-) Transcript_38350:20-439(-)